MPQPLDRLGGVPTYLSDSIFVITLQYGNYCEHIENREQLRGDNSVADYEVALAFGERYAEAE